MYLFGRTLDSFGRANICSPISSRSAGFTHEQERCIEQSDLFWGSFCSTYLCGLACALCMQLSEQHMRLNAGLLFRGFNYVHRHIHELSIVDPPQRYLSMVEERYRTPRAGLHKGSHLFSVSMSGSGSTIVNTWISTHYTSHNIARSCRNICRDMTQRSSL